MKLKELIEDLQMPQQQSEVVFQTNDYDEYQQFINNESSDNSRYHFEEVSPQESGDLFDIIVEVFNYSSSPETRMDPAATDIDWDVVYYGTGDFDNDTGFYFKKGSIPLPEDTEQKIEQSIIEDQDQQGGDDYDDSNEFHSDEDRYARA